MVGRVDLEDTGKSFLLLKQRQGLGDGVVVSRQGDAGWGIAGGDVKTPGEAVGAEGSGLGVGQAGGHHGAAPAAGAPGSAGAEATAVGDADDILGREEAGGVGDGNLT